MRLPEDYLEPVWRLRPDRPGPAAIALDPREACHVVANGCTLDGIVYDASFDGWGGEVQSDGRVTVRLNPQEAEGRVWSDATGHATLKLVEEAG